MRNMNISIGAKAGFSLVELSIVLVILGLLTGGILGGQALMRAAELKAIPSEHSRYITAVNTFKDRYLAIPGDMPNATKFWGIAAGDGSDAACEAQSSQTATCDGDGNGTVLPTADSNEIYRFWQHLGNAGIIEGTYNGISGNVGNVYTSNDDNSPKSKINNALWFTYDYSTRSGTNYAFDGVYGNVFILGGRQATSAPVLGIMTPEEMWGIDSKIDDGKPALGKVVVRVISTVTMGECTTESDPANIDADYRLDLKDKKCAIIFRQAF